MVSVITWMIPAAVAIERMMHYRTRGNGSRWFAFVFIVSAISVVMRLVGAPEPDIAIRAIAAAVTVLLAVAGGMYSTPLPESEPSTTCKQPDDLTT